MNSSNSAANSNNSSATQPFPIGTYGVSTYQIGQASSCTSNSATWQCYPGSTYNTSGPAASFTTQRWQIDSPTDSTQDLYISNTNPTFSYPFTNRSLTLTNTNDPRLSAFSFTFTYRKQVVPPTALTSDGAASRCYYNNTLVSVKLYNTVQGGGGNIVGPPDGSTTAGTDWPYAVEYVEQVKGGPECFKYSNGQETTQINVAARNGACNCEYRNYGLT